MLARMPRGPGLDAELSSAVQQLWAQARPGALGRMDVIDDAVAAVMVGALSEEQREQARRESHKLAGSLGTFGLRDATTPAAALESAFESIPSLDQVPGLAQHARDLRQVIEAGELGAPPPADGRVDVAAIGLSPERAAPLVAAGAERGLAIAAAAQLPAQRPPIALL